MTNIKLSSKNKEIIINILLLFVLPLIVYWIVLWNNSVTREYLASLECSDCPVYTWEEIELDKSGELKFLHYVD